MTHTQVAIIGASGYSGEELVRLLLTHPQARLTAVTSRQYAGKTVAEVFPRFAHHPATAELHFSEPNPEVIAKNAQVAFLALPHGVAAEYAVPLLKRGCRVIDLSADFRLRNPQTYAAFYGNEHPAPELLKTAVYGLPEIHRKDIQRARLIASPGCYPTSILLPIIPLLRSGLISPQGIIADSLSGVSGAGRKLDLGFLFCECNESLRAYGLPKHRHLSEIEEQLSLAANVEVTIQFTPHLVPVNRGILTTLYLQPTFPLTRPEDVAAAQAKLAECYQSAYSNEPFVRLLKGAALPDTKNVVGTNVLEMGWRLDPRTGRLLVISAEDNIIKGAGGQAVQCMNIACSYPETAGLI